MKEVCMIVGRTPETTQLKSNWLQGSEVFSGLDADADEDRRR